MAHIKKASAQIAQTVTFSYFREASSSSVASKATPVANTLLCNCNVNVSANSDIVTINLTGTSRSTSAGFPIMLPYVTVYDGTNTTEIRTSNRMTTKITANSSSTVNFAKWSQVFKTNGLEPGQYQVNAYLQVTTAGTTSDANLSVLVVGSVQ